ncbi:hypothetical protein BRC83_06340 [Halobacteriales archaeon QS_1_68_17]|nr:MAG: hypothetical protein BRC83_06340 [Halobacteriales archaeon QS_1_68_17]
MVACSSRSPYSSHVATGPTSISATGSGVGVGMGVVVSVGAGVGVPPSVDSVPAHPAEAIPESSLRRFIR